MLELKDVLKEACRLSHVNLEKAKFKYKELFYGSMIDRKLWFCPGVIGKNELCTQSGCFLLERVDVILVKIAWLKTNEKCFR